MPNRREILVAALAGCTLPACHVVGAESTHRIRVGQVGTMHAHASGKMSTMRKLDDLFEVVGVVEPDHGARQRAEKNDAYRGLPFVELDQLLETTGLAAVAVETSVSDLVENAVRCLQAGKHIHLDKPAGISMSACREMHAEANRRGLTIQMGYMFRYNPAFTLLFQMVRDGWLGDVTELNGAMGKLAGDSLRRDLAQYSGGGMFELSCHLIDAMVTVLGKPQKVQSYNRRTRPDADSFADNQLAVFEYPNAVATIRCNHIDPFGFARRQFGVAGTKGVFDINPLEPPAARLTLDQARGDYQKGAQDVAFARSPGRYDAEFVDLAKVIRGEKQLAWNSDHDLAVHEAVLAGSGMDVD
ncbi:Gfo/Idh/MocA family protein [Stieleria varia]|uniref:Putative oxidoreductase YhhX n=1 Tax=Stieleria varia TaxID=2528005 RepID=A0A5C5ZLS0_9BACT|nr:Gfo/Idh/MocA family oxidoreductase [Stieleria varia]TWT87781.1 putative oxidoreductase YhhX [Stieleria varia]